jgi:hypothetical protein
MVHEKRRVCESCGFMVRENFDLSSVRLAVGQIVDVVLRVFELLLLSYGLCGHNFCKTLQAGSLKP